MKKKFTMRITENRMLTPEICSMKLAFPEELAGTEVRPGQFVGIYPADGSRLLPRPISICEIEAEGLRLVFRCSGKGTQELSAFKTGEEAQILGILGNGYDLEALKGRKVLLLGGGIGIPPMLGLAEALNDPENVTVILGYRDSNLFLKEDFEPYARVLTATEDGSCGTRGNVLDAAAGMGITAEVICACGPLPMLRAVKQFAAEQQAKCYISLEERMACGVGVCLGCVCRTVRKDEHSQVNNTRICTEGPVFDAEEVEI